MIFSDPLGPARSLSQYSPKSNLWSPVTVARLHDETDVPGTIMDKWCNRLPLSDARVTSNREPDVSTDSVTDKTIELHGAAIRPQNKHHLDCTDFQCLSLSAYAKLPFFSITAPVLHY